ncbi:MAG: LacI family DNA-binding transcriptional regulator [Capsulimonadaceae bacterium]
MFLYSLESSERMPPTLKDIASRAGVSVATASNALNGVTKSRISADTIEHVRKVAAVMGYRPNAIARSLKYQRTDTIAFYTGYGFCDVRDRFLGEVVTGMQHACDELSLDLLLYGNLTKRPVSEVHRVLANGKIDGVVVHAAADNPVIELLASGSLHAVAIADSQPLLPSLVADERMGMSLLIEHLWTKGHRRIGFLSSDIMMESVQLRQAGYVEEMTRRGAVPSVYVHTPVDEPRPLLEQILAMDDRPTAMCCWHDDTAYYLLETCRELGVRVPEDLAIVGFDGLQDNRVASKHLVSVHVPWITVAFEAARTLVRLREGVPAAPRVVFPVSLIDGDTV